MKQEEQWIAETKLFLGKYHKLINLNNEVFKLQDKVARLLEPMLISDIYVPSIPGALIKQIRTLRTEIINLTNENNLYKIRLNTNNKSS